jgi:hypothetical protein
VLTGELQNNGNNKIDVNSIAAGAYIVKVTLDNNVVSTEHIQIIK